MLTLLAERPYESFDRACGFTTVAVTRRIESRSEVPGAGAAIGADVNGAQSGEGRFSVTCQAVEIGHQGSVSFKFSPAFH